MVTEVIVNRLRNGRYFAVARLLNPKLPNRPLIREAAVIRDTEAAAIAVAKLDLVIASLPVTYTPNNNPTVLS